MSARAAAARAQGEGRGRGRTLARAWARQAGARAHREDAKPALRLKKKEADKVGQGLPGQTFEAWRLDYTCRVLAISREWVTANALLILLLILTQCMHTPEEGLSVVG